MASLTPRSEAPAAAARGARPGVLLGVLGLLVLLVATQYPYALGVPFINDDYIFLEKTRSAPFASLFGFADLTFHWYRPWSRELHYWTLQRLFGAREAGFHLASLALWLVVMGTYFALARRLAGPATAAVATAGVAVMAAWAVPLLWVAGVQDLWMLAFGLLSLHALARGRVAASALGTALALLSKETAAVLPAIATLLCWIIERRGLAASLRRTAPHWTLAAAWAVFHPRLGGRLWNPLVEGDGGAGTGLGPNLLRTLLTPINLDALPAPQAGASFVVPALLAAAIVVALAAWVRRGDAGRAPEPVEQRPVPERSRVLGFGIGWAVLGWLPVFMPTLGWHSYYTLLGALGAWLAIAGAVSGRPGLAIALLVGCASLRAAQADTPSLDWGTEWYQRRAGAFLRFMRTDLLSKRPAFPPHSRIYFSDVPNNVGFMTRGGPALRLWYRDTTLSAGFYSEYRPRGTEPKAGGDFFFNYDSTAGWVEVVKGRENLARAQADNPQWEADHRELAALMARAEDWAGAALQFEKLATARPDSAEYALNAGVCYETLGDSANAAQWYRRAAAVPGASEEIKEFAKRFELRFESRR